VNTLTDMSEKGLKTRERDIIAVIFRDEVIVKILDHVGLPSRLPALKPASGPQGASFRQMTAFWPIPTTPSSNAWMSRPWSRRKSGTKAKRPGNPRASWRWLNIFPADVVLGSLDLLEEKKNEPE